MIVGVQKRGQDLSKNRAQVSSNSTCRVICDETFANLLKLYPLGQLPVKSYFAFVT